MTNQKKFQRRLLRDKQFGDKGGMLSKFKWSHECHTSQKIKAKRVKEVVIMHVSLSGTKALLGKNSYFWQGPLL
jgi:hypothetical protein